MLSVHFVSSNPFHTILQQSQIQNQRKEIESINYQLKQNQVSHKEFKYINTNLALGIALSDQFITTPNKISQSSHQITQMLIQLNGTQNITCKFGFDINSLCIIPHSTQFIKIHLTCHSQYCVGSYSVFQTQIKQFTHPKQTFSQENFTIYQFQQSANPSLAKIDLQGLDSSVNLKKDIEIYATNNFVIKYLDRSILVGFKNTKGYIYVSASSEIRRKIQITLNKNKNVIRPHQEIQDFLVKNRKSTYDLGDTTFEMDLELSITVILNTKQKQTQSKQQIKTNQIVKNDKKLQISIIADLNQAKLIPLTQIPLTQQITTFIYIVTVKQLKNIKIQLLQSNYDAFIVFSYEDISTHMVNINSMTYFNMRKGQELQFKMQKKQNQQIVKIVTSYQNMLQYDTKQCSMKQGCNFKIKALQDCFHCSHIYQLNKKYIQIANNHISDTILFNQKIFYSYVVPPKTNIKFIIDNLNIVVYMLDTDAQCGDTPSSQCSSYTLNYRNPVIIYNKGNTERQVKICVEGLSLTRFILRAENIGNQAIQLQSGQTFSYLLQQKQQQLLFTFQPILNKTTHKYSDVSINLVSPLNSLEMNVNLSPDQPKTHQPDYSSKDGYIEIKGQKIDGPNPITIQVIKTSNSQNLRVHFTIIVSTRYKQLHLLPTFTHYQNLQPNDQKMYLIQYSNKQQVALNFYIFNSMDTPKQFIQVSIQQVSSITHSKIIQQIHTKTRLINIKEILKNQCLEDYCELRITISNKINKQADIALTLVQTNSVIQLHDAIWQSFPISHITNTMHFYYFPYRNQTVNILYKSTNIQTTLSYSVYNIRKMKGNPADWAYPSPPKRSIIKTVSDQIEKQKRVRQYHINQVTQCWPSCVILMTFQNQHPQMDDKGQLNGQFRIMVSGNNLMEIPQNQLFDIRLGTEQKIIFIDLKHMLLDQRKTLTIFTHFMLGYANIYGNIYLQSEEPNIPTQKQYDYDFNPIETQIDLKNVLNQWQERRNKPDQSIYLALLVVPRQQTSMSLQYTSQQGQFRTLELDSYQRVQLTRDKDDDKNLERMFQIIPTRDYELKIVKVTGDSIVKIIECKSQDYEKCLERRKRPRHKTKKFNRFSPIFRHNHIQGESNIDDPIPVEDHEDDLNEHQINEVDQTSNQVQFYIKTKTREGKQCLQCIVFIWIISQDNAIVDIYIKSQNNQLKLRQSIPLVDSVMKNVSKHYLITTSKVQQTYIGVQILQGSIKLKANNYIGKKQERQLKYNPLDTSKNYVDIVIIPIQKNIINDKITESIFEDVHLEVIGIGGVINSFNVFYSSGDREIYLEDGIVREYELAQDTPVTFFYNTDADKSSHIYLSLTVRNSTDLDELTVKGKYFEKTWDQQKFTPFTPQKPPHRQGMLKSTVIYILPSNCQLIELIFISKKSMHISLSINHKQLLYIPINYEFPIKLHKGQQVYMISETSFQGQLEVIIKKCDENSPIFEYTKKPQFFKMMKFTHNKPLIDNINKFPIQLDSDKAITLYMKLKLQKDEECTLNIKIIHRNIHHKQESFMKAGNLGMMTYQLLDSSKAQITFNKVICGDQCQNIKYEIISSTDLQELSKNLYCPENVFYQIVQQPSKGSSIKLPQTIFYELKNQLSKNKTQLTFEYDLLSESSYVSIRAINLKTQQEVYYHQLKIITLIGFLGMISTKSLIVVVIGLLLGLMALIIVVRAHARRGYQQLPYNTNASATELND